MRRVIVLAIVGAFVLSAVPAFCQDEAMESMESVQAMDPMESEPMEAMEQEAPKYVKVYGVAEAMVPQGPETLMTVKLNEPMEGGMEKVDVILNEWSRVVREYEDLTMADLKVGQPVMVVYEINDEGVNEAVTINLEQ